MIILHYLLVLLLLAISGEDTSLLARAQQDFGGETADADDGAKESDKTAKKSSKQSSDGYDVSKTGFGSSAADAFSDYGVLLNDFENVEQEILETQKLTFVYVMNSAKVDEGTVVARIHFDMIRPVIKEMKGLIQAIVFDCSHPIAGKEESAKRWSWLGVCSPTINPEGMPNLQKVIPPELKKNPYTGKPMQKSVQQFP